jgi:predicted nuclease of predicted toxin-antitoxin system
MKTDGNIPQRLVEFLRERRYDVATVQQEDLVGASDDDLAEVASAEGRVLLTLDAASLIYDAIRRVATQASRQYAQCAVGC